ncbi:MAG: formyltetrahydrofolate deformylase, partial [Rhodobacteraceae bacterium]|nr:formyltetrahydrofolate deformylase [Paracoccaceae bacterium]
MHSFALTVACESARVIVAAIAGFLAEHGCNITDSSQFDDMETGRFFMRVSFASEEGATLDSLTADFAAIGARFGMDFAFHDEKARMKVIIMVS